MAGRGRPKGAKNKLPVAEIQAAREQAPMLPEPSPASGTLPYGDLSLALGLAEAAPAQDVTTVTSEPEPVCIIDDIDELDIRQKAIDMGLMAEITAATFPIAELRKMVADAQEAGLPTDTHDTVAAQAARTRPAAEIIRGLLGMVSVRNAHGLPMATGCIKCEQQPDHLKEVCVCRSARRYLEIADAGA